MQAADRPNVASRFQSGFQSGGTFRSYTPLQSMYLTRLQSLIGRRQQYAGRLELGDWRMRLLDKALYSTYRDCADLGLGDEARNMLKQMRQAQVS